MTETQEKTYSKELQQKVKELIDSGRVNLSTAAKGIGRSPASLSLYLQSKYDGRVDLVERDLMKYLDFLEKKEQVTLKQLQFTDTSIALKLFDAASMCHLKGKMGICWGAAGIGKSTAVLEYQKNNTGVIVVDPVEKTSVRAVLEQIADQLKVFYEYHTSAGQFIDKISKKLEKNKYLIIIDEAENLKIDIFKIIRKIHDKSKDYCGVLFVGTNELYELLRRVKNGFPYITSRIGYAVQLDALTIEDVKSLVNQYYPDCSADLIQKISKVCSKNARAVQNLLDICFDITSSKDIELNNGIIDTAKEKLFI